MAGSESPGSPSLWRRALGDRAWHTAQHLRLRARHIPFRLSPSGRSVARRLETLRDSRAGETCAILGGGPSLAGFDLSRLDGHASFCLNRGYLLWEEQRRSPDYFIAVNELVIAQFGAEMARLECPLFVPWMFGSSVAGGDVLALETRIDDSFPTDLRRGIAPGATVTIAALQVAYHLGFTTAILLGIDHRFETKGVPHAKVRQEGGDPNHFRSDYFRPGTVWNLPDLEGSERGYEQARRAWEADGRRIVNATPDSALDVFETAELDRALAASPPSR